MSFACKLLQEMLDPSQAVTESYKGCDDVPEPPSSPGESGADDASQDSCSKQEMLTCSFRSGDVCVIP